MNFIINILEYFIILSMAGSKISNTVNLAEPNIDEMEDLVCYQCTADSRDVDKTCDSSFLKLATSEEKYNMTYQFYKYNNYSVTIRGCTKKVDEAGSALREGCMFLFPLNSNVQETVICICNGHRCNHSNKLIISKIFKIVLIIAFTQF
ncbi:hypothetical protein RN001_000754 [Aquatica leii]|uniref:Protein quiver n=1 Tax=Aquatica leii TaxID=1421715 RepID=A0AAN7PFQ6_9COLE|nr:hypothetical protein RN001_000754 [Aquatica leii]